MKKSFVAVALVMGLGTTVAFAENLTSGVETVMAVNDFTPIEVKDLPAAVTEAIAKNFAESTVKEAAVEAAEDGSKTYQVVLTDKEGAESTVFFMNHNPEFTCLELYVQYKDYNWMMSFTEKLL